MASYHPLTNKEQSPRETNNWLSTQEIPFLQLEPGTSLPCSQDPASCSYHESYEPNPQLLTLFL